MVVVSAVSLFIENVPWVHLCNLHNDVCNNACFAQESDGMKLPTD